MASKKKAPDYPWTFRARFRRAGFGWKSQPAITRVRQAVAEITKVARTEPLVAAEGAVLFLERVSPALQHVDSSSGAIGSAVNRAIEELVTILAAAPADTATHETWLARLDEARAADEVPYIELLGHFWGDLCVTKEIASRWADQNIVITRLALSADRSARGYYHGSIACLSALLRAERYDEIADILRGETFWSYKVWEVKALAASGRKAEAIRLAEASRGAYDGGGHVARICEEILLSSGLADEAFERYAAEAHGAGTYLATFRAVAKKYPRKSPQEVLARLVASTPGEEGKWFAAAKEVQLLDEALALARTSPTDPRTLARAARDHARVAPGFAMESGLLALEWIARGHGYEVTTADVWAAYASAREAAEQLGAEAEARARARAVASLASPGGAFVGQVLRGQLFDA